MTYDIRFAFSIAFLIYVLNVGAYCISLLCKRINRIELDIILDIKKVKVEVKLAALLRVFLL